MKLVLLGLLVHAIFLYSIFDIYFKTPITHGATPVSLSIKAPAQRLILFVADGLRADKFYQLDDGGQPRAPFLRNVTEQGGAWGVSHTQVPTESRPGHVALIAGFYEDVSAIARGWKENPVEFDSVFNESRYTWSWGSPDILPMFSKGASGNHVFTQMYAADEEAFGGSTSYKLDIWVFDKFKLFLQEAKANSTLNQMVRSDKVVFFLHLLGIDTNGHSHKPMSAEYLDNIKIVDSGIEECVKLFEEYFDNDGKTAYILTSDHGMTDWGSHGSGDPEETMTPIVAWGAGIRRPMRPSKSDVYPDERDFAWNLSHIKRVDMSQADITPLMASLLGIPFPTNSMGILPVEFLMSDWKFRANAMLTNVKQLLNQYHLKQDLKNKTSLLFQPFKELNSHEESRYMSTISDLLSVSRYQDAVHVLYRLIILARKGIDYYHRYDRFILKLVITLTFIGWITYLMALLLEDHTNIMKASLESLKTPKNRPHNSSYSTKFCYVVVIMVVAIVTILYMQSSPVQYYAYFIMPVLLWSMVYVRFAVFTEAKSFIKKSDMIMKTILLALISVFGLEIIVLTFFYRILLSVGFFILSFWAFYTKINAMKKSVAVLWSISCLLMTIFPFLPTVGRNTCHSLVVLAGCLSLLAIIFLARRPELHLSSSSGSREPLTVIIVTFIQVSCILSSIFILSSTSIRLSNDAGIPFTYHVLSWITLVASFVLPLFGSVYVLTRLLNIFCSLMAVYLLLSSSYEAVFVLCFSLLLYFWLYIEHHFSTSGHQLSEIMFTSKYMEKTQRAAQRPLVFDDLRRAYFYIYFIISAFFGTGNIASLNSFNVSSVYCFITVFNPFIMGSLLILKVLIPFIMVTCVFRSIHVVVGLPTKGLLLVVLLMSDFMGLHFFFLVRDSGSWLDIGMSISHYVIVMTIIIFVIILYGLATVLTSFNLSIIDHKFKLHRL